MAKRRKHFQMDIQKHPDHEKINEWLDHQSNMQTSVSNIILVMYEKFGNVDITSRECQNALYRFVNEEDTEPVVSSLGNVREPTKKKKTKPEPEEYDPFKDIDLENL